MCPRPEAHTPTLSTMPRRRSRSLVTFAAGHQFHSTACASQCRLPEGKLKWQQHFMMVTIDMVWAVRATRESDRRCMTRRQPHTDAARERSNYWRGGYHGGHTDDGARG